MKLYQKIAALFNAYRNCLEPTANTSQRDWAPRHRDAIEALVRNHMPSGSGWDSGTTFDFNESEENRLIFYGSFHHINDGGMYDGWTDHAIIVTPSLAFGLELRVTGRNRNDIKDHLRELFHDVLTKELPKPAVKETEA